MLSRSGSCRVPWISLAVLMLVTPTLLADSRPVTQRAQSWVQAHKTSLPRSFESFAQYPREYQHAIFAALTPEMKAQIMAGRLRFALATESALTSKQRQFIQSALGVATPVAYSGDKKSEEGLRKFCAESAGVLPGNLRSLFQPGVRPLSLRLRGNWPALQVRVSEFAKGLVALHAGDCDCSVGSYCTCAECVSGYGTGSSGCALSPYGCGCFWIFGCDGMCVAPGS